MPVVDICTSEPDFPSSMRVVLIIIRVGGSILGPLIFRNSPIFALSLVFAEGSGSITPVIEVLMLMVSAVSILAMATISVQIS